MTIYDASMAIAVVAGMAWGAWRGITWQLASIASLVLGYLVAYPLSGELATHFPGEPVVARSLAMIATYVLVSGGVFGAAWVVRTTLRRWKFEAFDRHLGMILGGFEGGFLGLVATLFVVSMVPTSREPIFASPSGRVVGHVMDTLGPVLPAEARDVLRPFWDARDSESGKLVERTGDSSLRLRIPGKDGPTTWNLDPQLFRSTLEELTDRLGRAVADEAGRAIDRVSERHERNYPRR